MSNILIINAHEPYPSSPGRLNATLVERARTRLGDQGHVIRTTTVHDGYRLADELDKHRWADIILLQTPVYWMSVPWTFKRYMDEVYSAGMAGELCEGDGRTRSDPSRQYGSGGTLTGKRYMLSLTFNAPRAAFDDPEQDLFQGRSVDDLFFPVHMNFRFFGMTPLATFACYDVMKNPDIEQALSRFDAHLARHIETAAA
ncbi:NAD(P)H-dependent oxidoreductase [Marichromatium sp. AB32]|uniref:NAD(P)H-dependent oxidoreductase n=1 Tax=Marichromatium sp. AB32 TaxID=2483363 RepID=UPI000F40B60A|nr:NAD(P)H-dependent oxidoreductase [Marichromatium sp. AB32]RNE92784.1 flavodoxin family protein [Marichromatium sp. AB32]